MIEATGKRVWVFPDLELPPPGEFELKGHESLIILNLSLIHIYSVEVGGTDQKVQAALPDSLLIVGKQSLGNAQLPSRLFLAKAPLLAQQSQNSRKIRVHMLTASIYFYVL